MAKQVKEKENSENKTNDKKLSSTQSNKTRGKGKGKKSGKSKNKGFKPNELPKSDDSGSKDMAEPKFGNINDASMYYPDPSVAEQIQSYSFNQFVSVESNLGISADNEDWKFTLPNLMSILVNPCIPITNSLTGQNGVTTSGLRNFIDLVYGNARNAVYGPQDVILATLAVGNFLSTRSWLMRALTVAFKVDYRNRSFPEELFAAMHINAADMRANMAAYRIRFNTLITIANKIPFPGNVEYFSKCSRMFNCVYVDDDKSIMAQAYMLNPRTVWILDEAYDSDGTGLRTTDFVVSGSTFNFSHYLDIFEQQIDALLNSSTMNYVYADILRLVQKGNLSSVLYMEPMPEITNFEVVYSDEIQLWVHNMNIVGMPQATPTGTHTVKNDVKSDAGNNTVKYSPEWVDGTTSDTSYHVPPAGVLLDFYTDNPSIEDKVAATRLSASWNTISPAIGGNYYKTQVALLDWYVAYLEIFSDATTPPIIVGNLNRIGNVAIAALSHFRWNPHVIIQKSGSYDGSSRVNAISGELNYYTIVEYTMLKRMYDYEIINLLAFNIVK